MKMNVKHKKTIQRQVQRRLMDVASQQWIKWMNHEGELTPLMKYAGIVKEYRDIAEKKGWQND